MEILKYSSNYKTGFGKGRVEQGQQIFIRHIETANVLDVVEKS